ncbi:MAG: 4-(cytidine 5'-diphospho)-2-C-methyl-D-erythritol kinase [Chloroflexota bacterium]|nr:4-(cytidine 5'-diphospho)-2-C-methyl-D-erythritol kinase [Chloroflexota bacterium]
MSPSFSATAPAKINLTLEVLGKRPDGCHEIVSILQTIDLCDTLTVESSSHLRLAAPGLDCDESDNLVLKAAQLLRDATSCSLGAEILLEKRIPSSAGLGGGSSDAATALVALNQLWELGLGSEALADLAARLGSDVPFFFLGGATSLARGRGELLEPLPPLADLWVVLTVPPVIIPHKTKALYAALTPADFSDGSASLHLAQQLRAGDRLPFQALRNVFERPAFALYPLIASYREAMLAAGAPFVRLSGSGPALFTLYHARRDARALVHRLAGEGMPAHLTSLGHDAHPGSDSQAGGCETNARDQKRRTGRRAPAQQSAALLSETPA